MKIIFILVLLLKIFFMEYSIKYMRINFILRHFCRMKKIFIGYTGMKKIFKKYDDPVNCVYILMSIDKKILPEKSGSILQITSRLMNNQKS